MKRISLFIIFIFITLCNAFAQGDVIVGTVTDAADNTPIAGVDVLVEGTMENAITFSDGTYTIKASKGQVLIFSFFGMKSQKITVADSRKIDVIMESDVNILEDVIVVAYGTAKKESFTGSAEVVNSEKLKNRPATDITKMLDGQVSGVMTTSGSGQPGSGADIRIRGFGSINASNAPLLVVDGVPFDGDLNSINSSDIESMSVLKDASAGALYGARGANGVVLITTKKSGNNDERLLVEFSTKLGISGRAIPFYSTLDEKEYLELMYQAEKNNLIYSEGYLPNVAVSMTPSKLSNDLFGTDAIYNPYNVAPEELFDENGKIVSGASLKYHENWLETAQRKVPVRQEYQFGINGSGKSSKYMASMSYLDEQGTLATTGFKRYTGRAGADFSPKKWLDFGININFAHTRSDFLGSDGTQNTNVWYSAMMMAPIYPVYQKNSDGTDVLVDGNKVFDYGMSRPAGAQNNRNSVATLYDDKYYSISNNVSARGYVAVNFKGFKLSSNIGLDNVDSYESTKYNIYSGNAAGTGRLRKESGKMMSCTWNQFLSYNGKFDKHSLDIMAGHEFYLFNYRYIIAEKTGFVFPDFDDLGMGSIIEEGNSQSDNYSIDSYLFRVNWNYDDKYYVSGSLRADGSSRFIKENRWGLFWSVGASWRISQEKFLKDVSWINNLTLKASYGVQGNDNIGSYYAWQSLYMMNYPNAAHSGAVIGSVETKDVTWEKNGNLNVGIEFRLLNRISGTIEWYNRRTYDLLLEYPMPISLGFTGYYANVGSINNSGLDVTLSGDIISKENLIWNLSVMGSTLSNKVLHLTGDGKDIVNGVYIIREGEELNTFYMAKSAGVDPATGDQLYWAYEKDASGKMVPGSEFITNDSSVASGCKYLQGSRIPVLYGSISSTLRTHGFDLGLLFTYSLGGKIYDSVYNTLMEPTYIGQTYHKNALRAWTAAGQVTDVPRISTNTTSLITDRFLVDASYFAIKSISLGYTFEKLKKAGIESLRLSLMADSPWIFTNLKGMDPQASFSGSTSYTYTPNKSLSLGINLKF